MTLSRWLATPAGLLIGVIGALCGIGGGLFATPLQHYGLRVPLPRAVATSLAVVASTAVAATATELLRSDSPVPWTLVLAAVPGALLGAQVGVRVARRLPARTLKALFTVLFLLVATKLVLGLATTDSPQAELAGASPGAQGHLLIALVGLSAGLIVPVLGIGGGLLLVPGALLVAPELGFPAARGFSLAVAAVTSSRALVLRLRDGAVDVRLGSALGLGAAAGSVLGVSLTRLDSLQSAGQALLALILLVSAARFGRDALRGAGD